jgi:hypothetical protein
MLDGDTSYEPNKSSKAFSYFGASETVTTYKRETFKTAIATAAATAIMTVQEDATAANRNTVSGGWDTTDMSTQPMQTWFDGLNSQGYGFVSKDYTDCSNINLIRYYQGFRTVNIGSTYNAETIAGCSEDGYYSLGGFSDITVEHLLLNNRNTLGDYSVANIVEVLGGGSFYSSIYFGSSSEITIGSIYSSGLYGISLTSAENNKAYIDTIKYAGSGIYVLSTSRNNHIYNTTISESITQDVLIENLTTDFTQSFLHNCTLSSATPYSSLTAGDENHSGVFSTGQDGDVNKHVQKLSNGNIESEQTIRHTASGISWKMSPTNTSNVSAAFPLELTVARLAVSAGTLVTVNLWMRRSNTGITGRLMCKKKQIAGVSTDVYADITAIADTWEEVTITFTPTAKGVVEILAQCFGGTTHSIYVDDFSYTQA